MGNSTQVETSAVEDTNTPKPTTKLSKKSVDNVLDNLAGFSKNEQEQIKKMFGKLQTKGLVTNGQGGGTSYDTPEIIKFRDKFNKMVEDVSEGSVVTPTGVKKHYVTDNKGNKRFPMLYLRTSSEKKK